MASLESVAGFLQMLLAVAVPLFAMSSMASVGLGHDLREVTRPLRRPAMVATALLANFVIVPALCLGLLRIFELEPHHASGLFLVASAAGSPFLLALARSARADLALTGGLLLLLLPCTLVYMPLVVPLALPWATVDVGAIARPLALTMLLPLALGVVVRRRSVALADRLVPFLGRVSTMSLLVLVASTVLANLREIAALLVTVALPATALLIAGGVLAGFALGIPSTSSRVVLGLGTGQRNLAAAMIVATSGLDAPDALVLVVVAALVGFAVLFPAAWFFRRLLEGRAAARRVRFGSPETGGRGRQRA